MDKHCFADVINCHRTHPNAECYRVYAISFHECVNVCILGVSKFLSMAAGFDNGETNNKLMLYLY